MKYAIALFVALGLGILGYYNFQNNAEAKAKSRFMTYVCPKIKPMSVSSVSTGFNVDCECAYGSMKSEMLPDHFLKFLSYAEDAAKKNARRVEIPEEDIRYSLRDAAHHMEDLCITELF